MEHYTYITTNLSNGKRYVGDHSTDIIDDGYMGSGKIILRALKKYGKENFKKEILENFETKQEAFNAQEKYINKYNTLAPNGYNLSPTGGTEMGGILSEESRRKISETLSISNKGRKLSEFHKKQLSIAKKGIKFSKEHKEKLSKSKKGKPSFFLGKKHSDETKKKISIAGKGRKHPSETIQKFQGRIPWNKGIKIIKNNED